MIWIFYSLGHFLKCAFFVERPSSGVFVLTPIHFISSRCWLDERYFFTVKFSHSCFWLATLRMNMNYIRYDFSEVISVLRETQLSMLTDNKQKKRVIKQSKDEKVLQCLFLKKAGYCFTEPFSRLQYSSWELITFFRLFLNFWRLPVVEI